MRITPDLVLKAYATGIFPMAEHADDPALHWYEPTSRGIIPLNGFHISRSLAKTVRQEPFEVSVDRDFAAIIDGCSGGGPDRSTTWINSTIRSLYGALFEQGHCHTVEVRAQGKLIGGLYGVSLGGAFFGESMFHCATDASKVALVHLVALLRRGGYTLLDAQFVTKHLSTFGAVEISKAEYQTRLNHAITQEISRATWQAHLSGEDALALCRG
jgi:leucyl/phenylalanyl-tRNA---protein transferase